MRDNSSGNSIVATVAHYYKVDLQTLDFYLHPRATAVNETDRVGSFYQQVTYSLRHLFLSVPRGTCFDFGAIVISKLSTTLFFIYNTWSLFSCGYIIWKSSKKKIISGIKEHLHCMLLKAMCNVAGIHVQIIVNVGTYFYLFIFLTAKQIWSH